MIDPGTITMIMSSGDDGGEYDDVSSFIQGHPGAALAPRYTTEWWVPRDLSVVCPTCGVPVRGLTWMTGQANGATLSCGHRVTIAVAQALSTASRKPRVATG